jgi:hypothetical protein
MPASSHTRTSLIRGRSRRPRALVKTFLIAAIALASPVGAHAQQPAGTVGPAPLPASIEQMEAGASSWLAQQMVPNNVVPSPEPTRRRLLLSYRVPPNDPVYRYVYGRSAVYDDALGAIAFTMEGRYREAELLLSALSRLVGQDGQLWFGYNTQNDWPSESDHEGAIVRTGATAWVGYALTFYLEVRGRENTAFATQDPLGRQFLASAQAIAQFILARQVSGAGDPRSGLVTGGTASSVVSLPAGGAVPQEVYSAAPIQWVSTEHNIDSWYFLRDLGRVTADARYAAAAERIRLGLKRLWSDGYGQFIQGIHEDLTPDDVLPLDGASWGALFLLSQGMDVQAARSLDVMEKRFGVQTPDARGYRPYDQEPVYADAGVNRYYFPAGRLWADLPIIWGEGSLGVAAANIRAGRLSEGRAVMEGLSALAVDGGLRYASLAVAYQFADYPSVASTAWFIIAAEMLRGAPAGELFWGE